MHPCDASKMVGYAATNCGFTADMAPYLTTVEHVTIEGESESEFLFLAFFTQLVLYIFGLASTSRT